MNSNFQERCLQKSWIPEYKETLYNKLALELQLELSNSSATSAIAVMKEQMTKSQNKEFAKKMQ
jgi:hypothetical protein